MSTDILPEFFLPIPRFPKYEVSNLGRIRSLWRRPKFLRLVPNRTGYLTIKPCHGGKIYRCFVHRLVLEAFVGPCPPGMECRHLDGSRTNNAVGNLAWSTPSENNWDKHRHGTMMLGSRHANAKLNERKVKRIKQLLAAGVSQGAIAFRFGVAKTLIFAINRGLIWRHVEV